MLGACHLFVGALIGLVFYKYSGDRRAVPLAAFGALLPDLIDKPIGHVLLSQTVDYGRIYGHTLLFLFSALAIALLIMYGRRSILGIVVTIGVASHLLLDSMWSLPVTLFYPALGDFGYHHFPDYFEVSFLNEVLSPFEWIFLLLTIWITMSVYRTRLRSNGEQELGSALDKMAIYLIAMLPLTAAAYIILDVSTLIMVSNQEDAIILALIAVVGSTVLTWMVRNDYAGVFSSKQARRGMAEEHYP